MLGPVPGPLLLIVGPLILWLGLRLTPYLRQLYAVGANDTAAFSAGVNVAGVRLVAYVLDGLFAAVAGIALTVFLQTADATLSTQYTLVAIAAVVIGGTPIGGGRGGLLGSLVGAAVIYLLQNFLSEIHVSSTWLQVAYGAVFIGGLVLGARVTALGRSPLARSTS
jgi:ribose transport system permease protein